MEMLKFKNGLDAGVPLTASVSEFLIEWFMVNSGFSYVFIHSYAKSFCSGLDESVLEECLQYLEKQLENSQVRKAMEEFFSFGYLFICLNERCCNTHTARHIYLPVWSFFPQRRASPDYDGNSQWKSVCKVLQQSAKVLHKAIPAE